jgi:hypothetical protein
MELIPTSSFGIKIIVPSAAIKYKVLGLRIHYYGALEVRTAADDASVVGWEVDVFDGSYDVGGGAALALVSISRH